MSISINETSINSIHFTGIFGSGMSAIAQFLAWQGLTVSGSDRGYNKAETTSVQEKLEDAGCTLFEQNGAGIASGSPDVICISTAIESDNSDIVAAKKQNIPIVHRSDVLAAIVKQYKTIAVAGTSGKSTVTAMIFEFLTACGKSPSLITGAPLKRLEWQTYIGNAFYGLSDLLVIEADESDGSIVKYYPYLSVLLNISKDHKPVEELIPLFRELFSHSTVSIGNADDPLQKDFTPSSRFSLDNNTAFFHPDRYSLDASGGKLTFGAVETTLPLLGKHNLSNCIAALAVCTHLGCSIDQLSKAVASFEGVSRRFSVTRTPKGVTVVDDFAHNPEKIKAAISAARMMASRLIVIYQPHGFGPTRFLRNDYQTVFSTSLQKVDELYLLPIYYAGGTAVKNISSEDLKNDLVDALCTVTAPRDRTDIFSSLAERVHSGDCILVMGARDPSLPQYVEQIVSLFNES